MHTQVTFFRLKVVSPLHIGCDEVYEPTSFAIDEEKKELINFDPYDFLKKLDEQERQKFSVICQKGTIRSMLEIYKFIRRHAAHVEGERVILSPDLVNHYCHTLALSQDIEKGLNKFLISRTSFNSVTNFPYIPGSAVKGALRTAVLNLRHKNHPIPRKDYANMRPRDISQEAKNLEKRSVGGSFETDPFRLIKVSDFLPVSAVKRRISYAVDLKKKQSEKESSAQYQILEIIEPETDFIGTISVTEPVATAGIRNPITIDELCKAMKDFYQTEKTREEKELTNIGVGPLNITLTGSTNLLRIGRHSGAECVTVAEHRSIKISPPGKKPEKFSPIGASTVWLSANSKKPQTNKGLQPFGWAVLEKISEKDWRESMRLSEEFEHERMSHLQQRAEQEMADQEVRLAILAEKQAILKAREEEQQRQEEAARLYPWRERCLPKIQASVDWGQLKQCMEDATISQYSSELEVAQALHDTAIKIRANFKKGWEADRDQKITNWLASAGLSWLPLAETKEHRTNLSPDDQAEIDRILALKDWGNYLQTKIIPAYLSLPALQQLKVKMKNQWSCDDKKAQKKNPEKKKAWEEVNSLIKKAHKQ
jgi:CRISPR-associated protein Csm5